MIIFILLSAIKTHFTDLTTLSSDLTYDGILLFQRIHKFLISKMLKKKLQLCPSYQASKIVPALNLKLKSTHYGVD